ncbi:MAG TPA: Holliday junction branch migration protein RuvA [Thermoanaerobaculaceae bacterium]|nr:Holliday junction branch migration protein RuvA [Thermoanaerobaculaceae bacterium]HRS17140.1 Holliday junction branch migration protein RuvA [Thermoanaerobaculaceae bacterium]
MIGRLAGRIAELGPGEVVIDAGGVGYELKVPVSAHAFLAGKGEAALFVHTHVREDQIALFGFPTREERDTFRLLIAVSGVGPRTALALLSGLTPADLAAAVGAEQWRRLAAIPGIGRRTAERLIVELKGKLTVTGAGAGSVREDAVSALVNLGYSAKDAEAAVAGVLRTGGEMGLDQLLPRVLKLLVR